jgi:hypothetical protein
VIDTSRPVLLNSHERRLLRLVGLNGRARREMIRTLIRDGQYGGDIDLTPQEGGFTLARQSVKADLEPMFNRLMNGMEPRVRNVVYGHRTYVRAVVLAAALHQAGVTIEGYRTGSTAGFVRLEDFRRAEPSRPT